MTTSSQISEADIRACVGAQSLQRGRSYADNGQLTQPVPYRLNVTNEANHVVLSARP